jgi:hypothetical protein
MTTEARTAVAQPDPAKGYVAVVWARVVVSCRAVADVDQGGDGWVTAQLV